MNLNIQTAQLKNNDYFKVYSNGGYGKLPNPTWDDMMTTDQYVERRIAYPSMGASEYYTDFNRSPFYQLSQNRKITQAQALSEIQLKGVKVIGQEAFGKYSDYASMPDTSGYLKSYNPTAEVHQFLWVLIGVGVLAFVVNAMTP